MMERLEDLDPLLDPDRQLAHPRARINRQPVASVADYKKIVSKLKKGDTVLLRVRSGQAVQYLPVKLR